MFDLREMKDYANCTRVTQDDAMKNRKLIPKKLITLQRITILMLKNYFIIAIRNIRRNKTFSGITILGLAIGLAAFWMIALYIADETTYDSYHEKADRIYRIAQHMNWDGSSLNLAPTAPPMAPSLKSDYPEIQETVRIDAEGGGVINYGNNKLDVNDIILCDSSFFKIFTYHFLYGDINTALAKSKSIVLTKTLAEKIFGNAAFAVNKTILIDNNATLVTGVIEDVPSNSHLKFSGVSSFSAGLGEDWDRSYLYTYILLQKGTDVKKLEHKLPAFFDRHIKASVGGMNYRMELQSLRSIHLHSHLDYEISSNGNIVYIYVFSLVATLILLMAFINYANLTIARASVRVKEIGIRKVNGSKVGQLIWMFLTESVLLTFIAGSIAVFIMYLSMPLFQQLTGKLLFLWQFGIVQTLLILVCFSLLAGVVSGIYPALLLARFKPIPALKGKMGNQAGNVLFRKSLLVFQFVITVGMIAGSITIYLQLHYLLSKDLGFNKDQVVTFHLKGEEIRNKISALKEELLRNPLIESVAAASNPIGNNNIGGRDYKVEANGVMDTRARIAKQFMVDEDFISTLQIKIIKGRNFLQEMQTDKDQALLVNETLVKDAGWQQPIGKKIELGTDTAGKPLVRTVAGVVKDFHIYSLQHKVEPLILQLPYYQNDKDNIYVRLSKNNIPAALKLIEHTYEKLDPGNKIELSFLNQNFANQYKTEQRQGQLLSLFTILSVVISCLGLFGLITFTAQQRVREIGIRKVLGAGTANIVALLSKDFIKLVLIAFIIAIPLSWYAMNKWLADFAYRISMDGKIFVAAGIFVLIITLLTVSYQSIKAAIANPVKSLRSE